MNRPDRFFQQQPQQPQRRPTLFKGVGTFAREYVPPRYILEGIIRSGTLMTLTSPTGGGKTAFLINLALAVATGRSDILGIEVERGRVSYAAFENPVDLMARMMVAAFQFGIDLDEISHELAVLDEIRTPEEMLPSLAMGAAQDPLSLVIVDTFSAGFDGVDYNQNKEVGEYARRLRPISKLPGTPTVLMATHPVKGADENNLVPFGGGALLNEVDANLSLWAKGSVTTLHWCRKFRGADFPPKVFRFDEVSSPDVVDSKGKQMLVKILRPTNEQAVEQGEVASTNLKRQLLETMRDNPKSSLRELARLVGKSHSTIDGRMQSMQREKLVEKRPDRWSITKKGVEAIS